MISADEVGGRRSQGRCPLYFGVPLHARIGPRMRPLDPPRSHEERVSPNDSPLFGDRPPAPRLSGYSPYFLSLS